MATCAVCGRPIVGGTVPVDAVVCINCDIRLSMPTDDDTSEDEDEPATRTCFDCAGIGCDYCRQTGRIPA